MKKLNSEKINTTQKHISQRYWNPRLRKFEYQLVENPNYVAPKEMPKTDFDDMPLDELNDELFG